MNIEIELKDYILKRFKSIRSFAIKVGLTQAGLDNLLKKNSGLINCTSDTLIRICTGLDIDPVSLINGKIKECKQSIADVNQKEFIHLEKYRKLDKYGIKMVDNVTNNELERIETEKEIHPVTMKLPILTLEDIAKKFNKEENKEEIEKQIETKRIKNMLLPMAGGSGEMVLEDDYYEERDIIIDNTLRKSDITITVSDNSMLPLYADGDIVAVEVASALYDGEIGVFMLNGESIIKKQGEGRLISLNSEYEDIILNEYDYVKTIGRALGKAELI